MSGSVNVLLFVIQYIAYAGRQNALDSGWFSVIIAMSGSILSVLLSTDLGGHFTVQVVVIRQLVSMS